MLFIYLRAINHCYFVNQDKTYDQLKRDKILLKYVKQMLKHKIVYDKTQNCIKSRSTSSLYHPTRSPGDKNNIISLNHLFTIIIDQLGLISHRVKLFYGAVLWMMSLTA